MEIDLKAHIKEIRGADPGSALLAVSGGVDSMVLWHLLKNTDLSFAVAHMNFSLRAKASDADQSFVEELAKKWNSRLYCKKVDATKFAQKHSFSIQEAARVLRYEWFDQLMREEQYDYLITAHHLDDQIETFLINLNRAAGINGLSGIKEHQKLIRPLLGKYKAEIMDYADEHQVPFREDASNAKDDYLRNWFRNQLIPLWETQNPALRKVLAKTMAQLTESAGLIDAFLEKEESYLMLKETTSDKKEISLKSFDHLTAPKFSLHKILAPYGFNLSQMDDLLESIAQKHTGSEFYSKAYRLLLDREALILEKQTEKSEVEIEIRSIEDPNAAESGLRLEIIDSAEWDKNSKSNIAYFDAAKVKFPLKLRNWKEGDSIQPLGMEGKRKKISDILIDEKVDLIKKEECKVLISNQKIMWLLNYRMSEAFKVDESSSSILKIEWFEEA